MAENKKKPAVGGPYRVDACQMVVDPRRFKPLDSMMLHAFRDGGTSCCHVQYEPGDPDDLIEKLKSAALKMTEDGQSLSEFAKKELLGLGDKLHSAVASDDCRRAAIEGVKLGLRIQWLLLWGYDKDTLRGMKTLRAAKKGHVGKYGTTSDREVRREKYIADWNSVRKQHPHWSAIAVDREVAKRNGVSAKTIQRARPRST